jgi:MraZ protein
MALFLATHINKLDKKGRISIPSSFRTVLTLGESQQFVAFRSYKYQAIECCTLARMQQLSEGVDQLDIFSEAQDDFTAAIFADAQQISIDGDGRAVLPQILIEYAGLDESAAFVGRGATFQIWKPELFDSHQASARMRIKEHQASLKLVKEEHEKR